MAFPAVPRRAAAMACLLFCMVAPHAGREVFNVIDYGAMADGKTENSMAFLAAWRAACEYAGDATFVIPLGTFLLGPVEFRGPCYNQTSPAVEIKGTVVALPRFPGFGWVQFRLLHELTVGGGGTLDGQGSQCWGHGYNLPTTLRFVLVNNATVANLTLVNSKGFHVNFHKCINVDAYGLNVTAPADSPNTDGIHISGTSHINITNSTIGTGDDCVSVGPGSNNVFVSGVFCGPGHGISVGSLGKYAKEKDVTGLWVKNCTVNGTANGLRIKTWPGSPASSAYNITFEDVVMDNVSNPIIIDQEYCPHHQCSPKPSLVKISGVVFRKVRGTSGTEVAVSLHCSETVPCVDVQLEDINLDYVNGTSLSRCSYAKGQFFGTQNPPSCL